MTQDKEKEIVVKPEYGIELKEYERQLVDLLALHQLPCEGIFVGIGERHNVFKNVGSVIERIEPEQRGRCIYVSKFIAAVASGLFDAALNYLWDETIIELRRRVAQYDLSFFYDNAISSPDRRKELNGENDLNKISDSELIYGAKEIDLISDIGFKHLDYIRYMRNWISAAHPNQNEITGLQLVSWLETCIKEVISLPISNIAVETKKLLYNVKNSIISETDAKSIATFFVNLTQIQLNTLASGFFGIYTRVETNSQTRQNIRYLMPLLWPMVEVGTREQFGIKYGKYVAVNDQVGKKLSREFLENVSGQSYIPTDLLATEIKIAIDNLIQAHREANNFYSEPPLVRELSRLVGETGKVPEQVERNYVLGIVEVFITNGYGVAWNAEPIYKKLINLFNTNQASIASFAFTNSEISSHLQFDLCAKKFKELLLLAQSKVTAPAIKEFIQKLLKYTGPLDRMKDDKTIKDQIVVLRAILTASK